jgi:hypothetical protein
MVVDQGSAVDPVHRSTPDPPRSPDPPHKGRPWAHWRSKTGAGVIPETPGTCGNVRASPRGPVSSVGVVAVRDPNLVAVSARGEARQQWRVMGGSETRQQASVPREDPGAGLAFAGKTGSPGWPPAGKIGRRRAGLRRGRSDGARLASGGEDRTAPGWPAAGRSGHAGQAFAAGSGAVPSVIAAGERGREF